MPTRSALLKTLGATGGFFAASGIFLAPPLDVLVEEARSSWESTTPSDADRVSLAVVRCLAGLQQIAVRTPPREGSGLAVEDLNASASRSPSRRALRLSRSMNFTAGSFFVTRMLNHASSPVSSAAFQRATSAYIESVMRDPRAASSFLSTSGNATRLFQALDRSSLLSARVWASMKDIDDIYVRLKSNRDFDVVVSALGRYRQNEYKRRISLRMFRWWCQHSDFQFGGQDLVKAIDCMSTAASAVGAGDVRSKFDIVRSMRYIIEHVGAPVVEGLNGGLDVEGTGQGRQGPRGAASGTTVPTNTTTTYHQHARAWMWPLLCFAADGVGSNDWDLVNESLDAFTACVERGVLPLTSSSVHMIESSALPLLFTMSRDVPITRLDVRVRLAECIGALARGGLIVGDSRPLRSSSTSDKWKKRWVEMFVGWLVRLDPRVREGEGLLEGRNRANVVIEARALGESLVDALASLSREGEGGEEGGVVYLWLADLIVHLSRMATPYSDVGGVGRGGGKKEEVRLGWTSSAWWWSWVPPYLYGGSGSGIQMNTDEDVGENVGDVPITTERALKTTTAGTAAKPPPSDPELAMYINASPVGPVYARAIAQRLLEVSGNVSENTHIENTDLENMSPLTAASYSAAAAAVNQQVADDVMAQALKVTSALASGSSDNRRWLLIAGLPQMLRLFVEKVERRTEDNAMSTKLQRQVTRLLSLLSMEIDGADSLARNNFIPWLQIMAASDDCKVSSNAAKALLHVEAARESGLLLTTGFAIDKGSQKDNKSGNSNKNSENKNNLLNPSRARATVQREMLQPEYTSIMMQQPIVMPSPTNHHIGYEMMTLDLKKKRDMFAKQKRADAMWRNLRETRLVLHDGIHLMCPLAEHHETLAQRGTHADPEEGAPEMDIVFIHGIRGGAFITWRQEQALTRGGARGNVDHSVCWPAAWLAPKFPTARLVTAEYAAPATWWEGESLPLHGMVNNMAERLAAAGVGSRPVVFVCHSMGGLLVKEIISRGTEKDAPMSMRSISKAAIGAVFYSVPHAGSRLADVGWKLRYLGASPSRAVANLKTDPHLHDETNDVIRRLCKRDKLRVLSFSEGLPTKLSYKVYTHIVPHESAYPGYGEFQVLDEKDHISICKPTSTDDPAFATLVEWLEKLKHDMVS